MQPPGADVKNYIIFGHSLHSTQQESTCLHSFIYLNTLPPVRIQDIEKAPYGELDVSIGMHSVSSMNAYLRMHAKALIMKELGS